MRIMLLCERKSDAPLLTTDPADLDSEMLTEVEEDELLSGLRDAGHEVVIHRDMGGIVRRARHWRAHTDLVINRAEGLRGTERTLVAPAILDFAGLPYLGSTPYVQVLVRNKAHTKLVVAHAGIPTPPFAVFTGHAEPDLHHLRWPVIVKPLAESASIGIERVGSVLTDAATAIKRARYLVDRYDQPAIIETFAPGIEVEVPILVDPEPRALGVVALMLQGDFVDGDRFLASADVYDDEYGYTAPPPRVDIDRVIRLATTAARALGIRDYGRVDFRVAADGTPQFIEANTLPRLQRHSSFFHLARERGMAYHAMLDEVIGAARSRSVGQGD